MHAFLRALIVLQKTYRRLGIGGQLHVGIRFLTAPFLQVLTRVPRDAKRLLEIGGGHGAFAQLAADRGVEATVVDPDLRKLFAMGNDTAVRYVGGYDDCVAGTFDVIAILDVLYAIPESEWDAIFVRVHERLAPGGLFLLKEMDPRSWKQRWNSAQEALSSRFLGITIAATFNYQTPAEVVERLRRAGFASVEEVSVGRGYPHPHHLFVATK
jgi:cyclopropane fatty-acyl-phospholipid synthase-like methyltransferase